VPIDFAALSYAINSTEYAYGTCRLPPRADFSSSAKLRDVCDYHLQLRDEDYSFRPLHLIVVADRDYESTGLIVVYLDSRFDQDENDMVDMARFGVDMAASWSINLNVWNQNWDELKDEDD
jgi:hypothetical protein